MGRRWWLMMTMRALLSAAQMQCRGPRLSQRVRCVLSVNPNALNHGGMSFFFTVRGCADGKAG